MINYVGLDIGGTNIKAAIVNDHGGLVAQLSTPTGEDPSTQSLVADMSGAVREVLSRAGITTRQVAAMGIGSPGPIDVDAGVLKAAPNLPSIREAPLCRLMRESTGLATVLENDANAAALGEFWAGAGSDPAVRHMVMLTLGTGIGTGLIVDGQLVRGGHGIAGEGGHLIVVPDGRPCGCGQKGCLEAYASASQTARRAIEAINQGQATSLARPTQEQADRLTAKDVFNAALAGDPLAQRITRETAYYLGIACVSLCRLLDPHLIVFAGGMILAGDSLFDQVREVFVDHDWRMDRSRVRIVPACLGNDAGVIGAAAVAREAYRRRGLD